MYSRILTYPKDRSFFLFGPRSTGKYTWVQEAFPSGLFVDLNPTAGGAISWKQTADRVAVTFDEIEDYDTGGRNRFQIELFFNDYEIQKYDQADEAWLFEK